MKIKFFITLFSIALLFYLGEQESDEMRLQQIVIENNLSEDSEQLGNEITTILERLGAVDIEIEDAISTQQIVINFQSKIEPSEIKSQINNSKARTDSVRYDSELDYFQFDISYLEEFSGSADSGCEGLLFKEYLQDSFRGSFTNYNLLSPRSDREIKLFLAISEKFNGFSQDHNTTTYYHLIPDSRAGPQV